ncbi:MAG: hypothetical protein R3B09_10040 [Nannocystaceae bacterium]
MTTKTPSMPLPALIVAAAVALLVAGLGAALWLRAGEAPEGEPGAIAAAEGDLEPISAGDSRPGASHPGPEEVDAASTGADEPVPKDSPTGGAAIEDEAPGDAGTILLLYDDLAVLAVAPDPAWGSPPIATERLGERRIVRERAVVDRLPPGLRGLASADLVVYDGDGEPCLTALRGVDLYSEAREVDEGRGEADDERGEAEERARSRRLIAKPLLLVAEQDQARVCPGVWARRADLPPARVFAREAPEADERAALEVELLALAAPEVAALAAQVGDDAAALAPRIVRFRERGGPRELYSVELGEAGDPCDEGERAGPLGFLAERVDGRLVRLAAPAAVGVEAIVDLDRNGDLALVVQSAGRWAIVGAGAKAGERGLAFEIPAPACTI